jgi:hypothetical protein
VTIVDLLLQAYKPDLADALGVFLPLIVVNCIILGRAEAFASRNSVGRAAADGVAQGLGYTLVLLAICIIREFLGKGTFGAGLLNGGAGIRIFPGEYGALLVVLPVGGFLTLACLIAFVQWQRKRLSEKPAESTLRERPHNELFSSLLSIALGAILIVNFILLQNPRHLPLRRPYPKKMGLRRRHGSGRHFLMGLASAVCLADG